jgi:hypothetical protein
MERINKNLTLHLFRISLNKSKKLFLINLQILHNFYREIKYKTVGINMMDERISNQVETFF